LDRRLVGFLLLIMLLLLLLLPIEPGKSKITNLCFE